LYVEVVTLLSRSESNCSRCTTAYERMSIRRSEAS